MKWGGTDVQVVETCVGGGTWTQKLHSPVDITLNIVPKSQRTLLIAFLPEPMHLAPMQNLMIIVGPIRSRVAWLVNPAGA